MDNKTFWISAKKEKPSVRGNYLTTYITPKGRFYVNTQYFSGNTWSKQHRCPVVAWGYLPEPFDCCDDNWFTARNAPQNKGMYIVTYLTSTGRKHVNIRGFSGYSWARAQGGTVIAWQPLPCPYKENSTDKQNRDIQFKKNNIMEVIRPLAEIRDYKTRK